MFKKIIASTRSRTAKDASLMTVSTGIAAVLAAVFFILVARFLGPEKLGVFSLATAASFLLADLFDVALNTSLVRFVAKELAADNQLALKYLKYVFKLKLWLGILIFSLLAVFSRPFATLISLGGASNLSLLIGFGTALLLLNNFSVSQLQARQSFFKAGLGIILLPALRLAAFLGLIFFHKLEVTGLLSAYFFMLPLATLATLALAPLNFFRVKAENTVSRTFAKYTLPLTFGFALAAVGGRLDNFLLARLAGAESVGFYSAAFRLFTPLQFFAGSLTMVFAPRFSSFTDLSTAKRYFLKTLAAVSLLSLLLFLVIPFSSFIINLFYGAEFSRSVPVLRTLFYGFSALLLQAPFTSLILYYFAKTRLFALVNLLQIVLLIILNLLFIPTLSELGSAFAFIITQSFLLIVFSSYVFFKLRQKQV